MNVVKETPVLEGLQNATERKIEDILPLGAKSFVLRLMFVSLFVVYRGRKIEVRLRKPPSCCGDSLGTASLNAAC